MTLRTRLVAILAILITVGLAISGIATYGALRNFLYERVDTQVRDIRPLVSRLFEAGPGGGFPPAAPDGAPGGPIGAYAQLREPNGDVVGTVRFGFRGADTAFVPDLPDPITPLGRPFTVGAVQDSSYQFRVLANAMIGGRTLVVAIPLVDVQDTLQRLVGIEIVVALLLLAVISLGAWALIRRELQPLDAMASAATDIAAGDLSRRVDESDPRTEVGRLGRALNQMLEHIERAFEARRASEERMRRFLGNASHELRTPLTSIRGYAELFRRGAEKRPEDLRLSMRRIEEEAARMGILVDELLLLAHSDETRPMALTAVDLSTLVTDAAQDARARDPGRPVEINASRDVVIQGDEDRLRQALANLVTNALVHTPAGTPVALELSEEDGTAIVAVEDSGPGLDDDTLAHAFERFWRRDQSRSRVTGGTGLGLAIVDAIARGHGGSVTAENRASGGARFTLRLPIDPQQSLREISLAAQVEAPD